MAPEQLEQGINFFNSGRYFEAHEVWEGMWREEQGPLRLFLQGLIQAAVGLHHLSRNNPVGAQSQLAKSLAKLSQYPAETERIDVVRLRRELEEIVANAGTGNRQIKICYVSYDPANNDIAD